MFWKLLYLSEQAGHLTLINRNKWTQSKTFEFGAYKIKLYCYKNIYDTFRFSTPLLW